MEKTEAMKLNEGSQRGASKNKKIHLIIALPMILTMAILPLIVRDKKIEVPEHFQGYIMQPVVNEPFSYYKSIFLFVITALMLAVLIYIIKKEGWRALLPKEKATRYILGGILFFLLFSVISTAVTPYREFAIIGSPLRFEGMLVYFCYIVIALYPVLLMSKDEKYSCIVPVSFAWITLFFLVLTVAELFGKNLLNTGYIHLWTGMEKTFPKIGRAVMIYPSPAFSFTMYNPNFVGSFCAMAFPIFFIPIFDTQKKIPVRLGYEFLCFSILLILSLCKSQAGMVGVGISSIVALFFLSKKLLSYRKKLITASLALILILIGAGIYSEGKMFLEVIDIFQEGLRVISIDKDYVHDPTYGQPITDVIVTGKLARVVTTEGDFFIDFTGETIVAESLNQKESVPLQKGINFIPSIHKDVNLEYKIYEDKRFVNIRFQEERFARFAIYQKDDEAIYIGLHEEGYPLEPIIAPHWGFEGKEKVGSGRGYIWSRSIPLIKDTLLLGYGPDTYVIVFPQGDYLAKTYMSNAQILVDKPHSLYLQWMINHGVVATIGILFALGGYILTTVRMIKRKMEYAEIEYRAIAILSAVCGYLAAGFFNDSIVPVAPIFWALLGFGISINRMQAGAIVGNERNGVQQILREEKMRK